MTWDHLAKQKELALAAINKPKPYRPIKVRPHDPARPPALVREVGGWFGTEMFLVGKTPEAMEKLLGFATGYLRHGVDLFVFLEPIRADQFDLKGAYTHLPGGRPWNGVDLKWPPGLGAPQWELNAPIPCRHLVTLPRGTAYRPV